MWVVKSERPSGSEDVDTCSWEQVLLVCVGMRQLLFFSSANSVFLVTVERGHTCLGSRSDSELIWNEKCARNCITLQLVYFWFCLNSSILQILLLRTLPEADFLFVYKLKAFPRVRVSLILDFYWHSCRLLPFVLKTQKQGSCFPVLFSELLY